MIQLGDVTKTQYLYKPPNPRRIARADVAGAAELLVGVPFLHQGSNPDTGLDCRGVLEWVGLVLFNRPIPPRDYQRRPSGYEFYEKLKAELIEIEKAEAGEGDIVLIRFPKDPEDEAKHGGILAAGPYEMMLIHAWESRGRGEVKKEPLRSWKERNILHAFRFPEVE